MKIRQHRPNFFDSDDPIKEVEFSTVRELLDIDWVNQWSKGKDFVRFSIAKRCKSVPKDRDSLMAEFINEFWVVGSLTDTDNLELPEWVYKKED